MHVYSSISQRTAMQRFVFTANSNTAPDTILIIIPKKHASLLHTVGPILSKGAVTKLEQMPKELFDLRNTESMDGNGYVSKQLHQAFHHYIKVTLCYAVACVLRYWVLYCAVFLISSFTQFWPDHCFLYSIFLLTLHTVYWMQLQHTLLVLLSIPYIYTVLIIFHSFLRLTVISLLQVVSTTLQPSLKYTGRDSILAYQMVQSSQIMQVSNRLI